MSTILPEIGQGPAFAALANAQTGQHQSNLLSRSADRSKLDAYPLLNETKFWELCVEAPTSTEISTRPLMREFAGLQWHLRRATNLDSGFDNLEIDTQEVNSRRVLRESIGVMDTSCGHVFEIGQGARSVAVSSLRLYLLFDLYCSVAGGSMWSSGV